MNTRHIMPFLAATVALGVSAQSNYDFTKMQREKLSRGVVAVRENPQEVAVSWRYLSSDPEDQAFDVLSRRKEGQLQASDRSDLLQRQL